MKKFIRAIAFCLLAALLLPFIPIHTAFAAEKNPAPEDFRAVWVSTVYNLDYPNKAVTDPATLKKEADALLDNAKNAGLNAVILQVRPSADALYPSKLFPWSVYLTGNQDTAPKNGFDPLAYWIEAAHKRGLKLHAWVNPYRITKGKDEEFSSLSASNPAKKHPDWVVKHTDGNYYFNPGIPEVQEMVVAGVMEIVNGYDVDGIHLDDYFYPGKEFADSATFQKYGAGFQKIEDWRRENVNRLISELEAQIHGSKPGCVFGVSPAGVWANKQTDPRGSDTTGYESYASNYADSLAWIENGWIDYICPQIYWYIGQTGSDYKTLLEWWSNAVKGKDVKLYIGMAIYRAGNQDTASPWFGTGEIIRQLTLNKNDPRVSGSIMFRAKFLKSVTGLTEAVRAFYDANGKQDNQTPTGTPEPNTSGAGQSLQIGRPTENVSTSLSKYYITGTSNPALGLTVNGKEVAGRSSDGYFGVLMDLKAGKNTFTFQQGDKKDSVTITKTSSATSTMSSAKPTNLFPQSEEMGRPGDKITLKCTAPIGSTVKVKINGNTYAMKPAATKKPDSKKLYATTFSYTYTLPGYGGTARNVSQGKPVYTVTYQKNSYSATAPGEISTILYGSPYLAEVTADIADTYFTASSANGSNGEIYKGQRDYVCAVTGSYAKLTMGSWVKKSSVKLYTQKEGYFPAVTGVTYTPGDRFDRMSFTLTAPITVRQKSTDKQLTLTLPSASGVAQVTLPEGSLLSAASGVIKGSTATYTLTFQNPNGIDGWYLEKTDNGFDLYLKRPVKANTGNTPLAGITILLDPGHGGTDPGSIGCAGLTFPEKSVNLQSALKIRDALQAKGATVLMTREEDTTLSLMDRVAISREKRPDLFLSVHANSLADNADLANVRGLAVFYRDPLGTNFAKTLFDVTKADLSRPDKGVYARDHYVTKGTWCPSAIYESGFMPNPQDFQWLRSETEQKKLADSITHAVIQYFSN